MKNIFWKPEFLHLFCRNCQVIVDDDWFDCLYDGSLLTLALDLGERLLAAFDTESGLPFGWFSLFLHFAIYF